MPAIAIKQDRTSKKKPDLESSVKTSGIKTEVPKAEAKTLVEILKENDIAAHALLPDEVRQRIAQAISKYLKTTPALFGYELREAIQKIQPDCGFEFARSYYDATNRYLTDKDIKKTLFRKAFDEVIAQKYHRFAVSLEVDASRFGKGVSPSSIFMGNIFYKNKDEMMSYLAGRLHEDPTSDGNIKKLIFR